MGMAAGAALYSAIPLRLQQPSQGALSLLAGTCHGFPLARSAPPTTGRWSDQWLFMAFIQGLHQDPERLRHLQFLQTWGPVLLSVLTGNSDSDQGLLSLFRVLVIISATWGHRQSQR